MTIKGKSFGVLQGSVKFNGNPATITSWSDTAIICTVPVGATTGPVQVTNSVGTSVGKTFTVQTPSIKSLSPTSGTIGLTVTIKGKYFGADQGSVTFNGILAAVSSWSDAAITCAVPVSATTGSVQVTNLVGASAGKTFTVKLPSITSLSPTSGTIGMTATIKGKYFGATQGSVTFNGTPATVTSWSDTVIICTVPVAVTTGSVQVTNLVGTSAGKTFTVKP